MNVNLRGGIETSSASPEMISDIAMQISITLAYNFHIFIPPLWSRIQMYAIWNFKKVLTSSRLEKLNNKYCWLFFILPFLPSLKLPQLFPGRSKKCETIFSFSPFTSSSLRLIAKRFLSYLEFFPPHWNSLSSSTFFFLLLPLLRALEASSFSFSWLNFNLLHVLVFAFRYRAPSIFPYVSKPKLDQKIRTRYL